MYPKKIVLLPLIFFFTLITKINSNAQTIETVAGTGVAGFSGDSGPATMAQVNFPGFICFGGNGDGSIFIGDRLNYRVREMKYGGGVIFTRAGAGTSGFSGDGGPATAAQMGIPGGVAADNAGNVFFCDYDNHRIRKIDVFGTITTIAGTGVLGYGGDGGPATAARFYYPLGITIDPVGNLYVADQYNHRIRKISVSGTVSTVVGTGVNAFGGDGGPATAAMISFPNYIRMDTLGNLIVTDNGGHRIRVVDGTGTIRTVVGTGVAGYSGDGGPATAARIRFPGGTSMDNYGNLFFCDAENHAIRMVDHTTGNIYTMAGTGVAGYSGDGGPATAARLNKPVDLAVDHYNNIYFVDWYNSRVRMFAGPAAPLCDAVTSLSVTGITPSGAILNWAAVAGAAGYEYVVDMSAADPTVGGVHTTGTTAGVGALTPSTTYFAHVRDSCSAGFVSAWITVPFNTLPPCDPVTGLSVTGITTMTATLNWTTVAGSLGYEYVVDMSASDPVVAGTHTTATTASVSSLTPGTSYYAHVRDSCGIGYVSSWVTVPFITIATTTVCDTVTGLAVTGITASSATLSWTAVVGSVGYKYLVNTTATPPIAPGTLTVATTATAALLSAGTSYYAHVRDSCGAGNVSGWITKQFSTLTVNVGVANARHFEIHSYPNPVKEQYTVVVESDLGAHATIVIADMAGRVMMNMDVTNNIIVADMRNLAAGIYLLTYRDEQHLQTLKLIKQ